MQSDNRSRRHFLAGCLAAVAAWFLSWRKAAPARPLRPDSFGATVVSGGGRATEARYDVEGRLVCIVDRLPTPGSPLLWTGESDGGTTPFRYG